MKRQIQARVDGLRKIQVPECFPVHLDDAALALAHARGVIHLLTGVCEAGDLIDTHRGAITESLYTALDEVERAQVALFGEKAPRS